MWNQGGDGGGGFVASSQGFDSPAGGADKQAKGRRAKNIVPATVKQLMDCHEEKYRVVDVEAEMVTILGLVSSVESSTTKISLHLDDQSGTIQCIIYLGTGSEEEGGGGNIDLPIMPVEGTYGRVVGALRSTKGVKYVLIYRYLPVTDMNELTCHLLEVVQVPMKLKKLSESIALKTGVGISAGADNMNNTLSNSMMLNNFGGDTGSALKTGGTNNRSGFNSNQNLVLSIIRSNKSESGTHRDEIIQQLKGKMGPRDVTTIIEELGNEGHIFSTVDDDHFSVTD